MKKLLTLLLSLVMVLSLVPNVWGTDGAQPEETPPETVKTEETAELQETIEAEETVNVPALQADESGEESVITRLKKAGYTAPEKSEIHIMFPDALEYGCDYTCKYENGVLTVHLLRGDLNHWVAAYQSMSAAGNNIEINIAFDVPSGAVKMADLCSNGDHSLGVTYMYGSNAPFACSSKTVSVASVDDPVDAPTLIGSGLTLVGTRYPQECGGNSLYIELAVIGGAAGENKRGLPALQLLRYHLSTSAGVEVGRAYDPALR